MLSNSLFKGHTRLVNSPGSLEILKEMSATSGKTFVTISICLHLIRVAFGGVRQIDRDISLFKFECSLDWSLFINWNPIMWCCWIPAEVSCESGISLYMVYSRLDMVAFYTFGLGKLRKFDPTCNRPRVQITPLDWSSCLTHHPWGHWLLGNFA